MSGNTLLNLAFEALGLNPSANITEQDVNQAYRNAAKLSHPDKNPNDPSATARFQAIQDAHERVKKYVNSAASRDKREEFADAAAGGKRDSSAKEGTSSKGKHPDQKPKEDEKGSSSRRYNQSWKDPFWSSENQAKTYVSPRKKGEEHDPWDKSIGREQKVYKSPYPVGSLGESLLNYILASDSFWAGPKTGEDELWMNLVLAGVLSEHGKQMFISWGDEGESFISFQDQAAGWGKVILNRFLKLRHRKEEEGGQGKTGRSENDAKDYAYEGGWSCI